MQPAWPLESNNTFTHSQSIPPTSNNNAPYTDKHVLQCCSLPTTRRDTVSSSTSPAMLFNCYHRYCTTREIELYSQLEVPELRAFMPNIHHTVSLPDKASTSSYSQHEHWYLPLYPNYRMCMWLWWSICRPRATHCWTRLMTRLSGLCLTSRLVHLASENGLDEVNKQLRYSLKTWTAFGECVDHW